MLVSVGRRPYLDNLGVKNVGVLLDDKGRVKVDDYFRTSVPKYAWSCMKVMYTQYVAHNYAPITFTVSF